MEFLVVLHEWTEELTNCVTCLGNDKISINRGQDSCLSLMIEMPLKKVTDVYIGPRMFPDAHDFQQEDYERCISVVSKQDKLHLEFYSVTCATEFGNSLKTKLEAKGIPIIVGETDSLADGTKLEDAKLDTKTDSLADGTKLEDQSSTRRRILWRTEPSSKMQSLTRRRILWRTEPSSKMQSLTRRRILWRTEPSSKMQSLTRRRILWRTEPSSKMQSLTRRRIL